MEISHNHLTLLCAMAARTSGQHLVMRSNVEAMERDLSPLLHAGYIRHISPLSRYAPGFEITSKGRAFLDEAP